MSSIFETIEKHGEHEEVVVCYNKDAGLKAFIAIHNTALGPALGGTRMWTYKNDEEALVDVLRLSKGMTYKAAASGLNLGGGKAVIIGDPKTQKSEALFRAFGQYVNSLSGRYITAEDVGTSVADMEHIYAETPWVTGIPKEIGGSGDPSPFTAHGVLQGIKAAAKMQLGSDQLKDLRVAVQGLGNVGYHLCEYLHKEGAHLIVADTDQAKTKIAKDKFDARVVSTDEILSVECDIIAPCALGAVFNDVSIPKIRAKVIAGGANNQLAETRHGMALKEMGILYAPDFVINAGGLMNVFVELEGYSRDRAMSHTFRIYDTLMAIFKSAKERDMPTHRAAEELAEKRISQIGKLRQHHSGRFPRQFGTLKVDHR